MTQQNKTHVDIQDQAWEVAGLATVAGLTTVTGQVALFTTKSLTLPKSTLQLRDAKD